jgi:hypothetical protein
MHHIEKPDPHESEKWRDPAQSEKEDPHLHHVLTRIRIRWKTRTAGAKTGELGGSLCSPRRLVDQCCKFATICRVPIQIRIKSRIRIRSEVKTEEFDPDSEVKRRMRFRIEVKVDPILH